MHRGWSRVGKGTENQEILWKPNLYSVATSLGRVILARDVGPSGIQDSLVWRGGAALPGTPGHMHVGCAQAVHAHFPSAPVMHTCVYMCV